MGQKVALYCRVSTADQSCARQERDLLDFVARAGYEVVGIWKETASGTQHDRVERNKVMALAQARQIDAILVTELTRWGRRPGQCIKADRLAPKVLERVKAGWSYRKIGKALNISKNTVTEIVKRDRHHRGV